MGELQHGTYDDCEDLTEEEVNVFYNFCENGELHSDDEDPDQSDYEDSEDFLLEGYSEDHSTSSMDVNESENIVDSDHEFQVSTAVCCS
jgi:hypothetical protein